VSDAGAHLMGATTYAVMAPKWLSASGPFAKPMNEIPKVEFSDSLASADWGETTISGPRQHGGDVRLFLSGQWPAPPFAARRSSDFATFRGPTGTLIVTHGDPSNPRGSRRGEFPSAFPLTL
jgi:hypothetical protein